MSFGFLSFLDLFWVRFWLAWSIEVLIRGIGTRNSMPTVMRRMIMILE